MRHIPYVILIAAVAGCDNETQVTQPVEMLAGATRAARYDVVELSASLGGTRSRGTSLNDQSGLAGFSTLPGDTIRHATLWQAGSILDLGTLGGPNSNVQWPGQNDRGTIVGIAETAAMDSLGEEWSCSAFFPTITFHLCRGFVWESGVMRSLPTLGGDNGFATGVNNRGQVVGWAETPVHDPTCNSPQVLQFRAVVWEARNGLAQELPPFPGDSTSAATAINDKGQVVGISGACDVAVGRFSATHAVLWQHGTVIDLGNLGGISWHTPMAINDAGDVAGFSNPAGDADGSFIAHAFLWTKERGMRDLGTLPGDDISEAFGINARRQVVGISCGAIACRPFLWQDGEMRDLNTLVVPGFTDPILSARHINNAGKITGDVLQQSTGQRLAFVATPK